jgi:hypothetical protein
MLAGGDYLRCAADLLAGWSGDREILREAAEHFWSAGFHAPEWPESLRVWHERIVPLILAQGTVATTVVALSDSDAHGVADEISRFCGQALADTE